MSESKQNGIVYITKYWHIIIFFGSLVVMWTTFRLTLNAQTGEIASLRDRISVSETANNQVLVQLSQIQADLAWIKLRLK